MNCSPWKRTTSRGVFPTQSTNSRSRRWNWFCAARWLENLPDHLLPFSVLSAEPVGRRRNDEVRMRRLQRIAGGVQVLALRQYSLPGSDAHRLEVKAQHLSSFESRRSYRRPAVGHS